MDRHRSIEAEKVLIDLLFCYDGMWINGADLFCLGLIWFDLV